MPQDLSIAGDGLVPSGNKPLLEPMLTEIYGIIRVNFAWAVLYAISCYIAQRKNRDHFS